MRHLALAFALCPFTLFFSTPLLARVSRQEPQFELQANEVAERHGLILHAVGRGELEAGAARLAELQADPLAAELVAQIETDLARTRALIELRTKHIEELVAKGKRQTLESQRGKIVATVTAFADGKLTLSGAKSAPPDLAADELLLLPLVRGFSAQTLEGVDASVRGYALVLAGDTKAVAALKGSPSVDQLKIEAVSFYKGALELGAAAELVSALAKRGKPADAAAAKEATRDLELIAANYIDLPFVSSRRSALSLFAVSAYEPLYDDSQALEGLVAEIDKLPDGRVRLTYDFKKLRRTTDFSAEHDYLKDIRSSIHGPKAPPSDLAIEGGFLRMSGDGVWRHALDFIGPLAVTYSSLIEKAETPPAFVVVAYDDRAGSFVMCYSDLVLHARDIPSRFDKHTEPPYVRMLNPMKPVATTFTLADGVAYAFEDGKEAARMECGPRKRGGLCFVLSGTGELLFNKIVIEGCVDLEALRMQWAKKMARELGL